MVLSQINLSYYQELVAGRARGDRGTARSRISRPKPAPAGTRGDLPLIA